ncbi:MAG: hypothetical protein P3X22_007070 [Thermoprotei archaeon]|nr:hypothetical protein [Thermoprotei archaeon]
MDKILEYGLALGFPLIVFALALTFYPVDYVEANLISGTYIGGGVKAPGYVNTVISVSGFSGWVSGYGRVVDVEEGFLDSIPVYMLKVNVRGNIFNVILVDVENMEFKVSRLKGANIMFYGPLVEVKGARIVLAKATVAGIMEDTHMEVMRCMHKKGFNEKCRELLERHEELMREMHERMHGQRR